MLGKRQLFFIVRFVLVLGLFTGMTGVGKARADSWGADTSIPDPVTITVLDTAGTPKAGLNVYAFDGAAYTGLHGIADENGQLSLQLPEGAYRFRADLNGTQFWSATSNHCSVPGCGSVSITVSQPVTLTVLDTDGGPKTGLNVYAFNNTTYSGYNKTTNADGQATFTLPLGSYRFRADLNGTQFWSGMSNHCDIPGCEHAAVTVSKPVTVTVLDTDGAPEAGLNVYAFNNSTYSGYNKTTNAEGQATFILPLGSYRFRADLNGTQFWSGTANHCDIPGCEYASITASKSVTVTVRDTDGTPKGGLNVYAFNNSTYSGYNKTTNAEGQAVLTLPLGNYRFRADLNGTQFWSGAANHCDIPGCENVQVTVTIPLTVTVQDGGGVPKPGVNVYAFNGTTYTGYSKVSDASGQVVFTLPQGSYRFRGDYAGAQYWSALANHCALPGCLNALVTVGPPMTATPLPTNTSTATATATRTSTPTYTPTAALLTISGNAGVSGATLSYVEAGISKTVIAGSTGDYVIRVSPGWSGTVTPSKTNVTFNPSVQTYPALWGNITAQNYTASIMVINANSSGSGSFSQAVWDASSGSTIRFAPSLSGRTIVLSSNLTINSKKLILDGSGLTSQVTISGNGSRGFNMNGLSSLDIHNLTLANFSTTLYFRMDAIIENSTLRGFAQDAIIAYESLTITNSTLKDNLGYALNVYGPTATITKSVVQNNAGGMLLATDVSTISDGTVSGNDGDAVISFGSLTITDSTVAGNRGMGVLSSGPLLLKNSAIYENSAEGVATNGAGATIVNSTIAHNQAQTAAIRINGGDDVDIYNSTIIADTGRAVLFNSPETLNLYNSVLLCIQEDDCILLNGGPVNDVNSVIVINGTLAALGLSELAYHGGPTLTMALLAGSPLIDTGDDTLCAHPLVGNLDQRGVVRPQGMHCDIGAYEAGEVIVPSATATLTSTFTPTSTPTRMGTQIPTGTPTITSTPVAGCNAIRDAFIGASRPIKIFGRTTIYLDLPNPNSYPVTIQSIYLAWNYNGGHNSPFDQTLRLQKAELSAGSVFWTGDAPGPSYVIAGPYSPPLLLPPGGARLTFTFHQSYDISRMEEINIQFSTPGCEAYPVQVRN